MSLDALKIELLKLRKLQRLELGLSFWSELLRKKSARKECLPSLVKNNEK